jgi:predicted AAA+ superfamily ATPase
MDKDKIKNMRKVSIGDVLLRGFYPEIVCNLKIDRQLWCGSYLNTYVERDVRNISNVGDLNQFERFLRMCAVRTGQILNLSEMARDIGISVPTAKRWLSLLETGYQIFLLYPYYRNIGKRLVKSPKLYFNDTALCSYLFGINDIPTLLNGPGFSCLFETMVVCDFHKRFLNFGEKPSLYYLRTQDGLEIDLVIELAGKLHLFEIKSGETIVPRHAASLKRMYREHENIIGSTSVISGSEDNFLIEENVYNYGWKNILLM